MSWNPNLALQPTGTAAMGQFQSNEATTAMTRHPVKRPLLAVLLLVGILILGGVVAWAFRVEAHRAEAVRIARRAYIERFGGPPPTPRSHPGSVVHLDIPWEAKKRAYLVDFGYQYVDSGTRRDVLSKPIPFASFTAVESFEVRSDGRCVYLGHHSGGPL